MNQHLVSRVLLSRFSNHRRGPITGLDLATLESRTDRVETFGAVANLLSQPSDLELRWHHEVEKRLPHTFNLLDAGTMLDHPDAIETVKNCIALHVARSGTVLAMIGRLKPGYARAISAKAVSAFDATTIVHVLTGLHVAGQNAATVAEDAIAAAFNADLQQGDFLATVFDDLFERGRSRLAPLSVEILEASEDEFLLSDSPVSYWARKSGRVGILQGVTWETADAICMPLGPRHAVALTKTSRHRFVDARMVEAINSVQITGSIREVYLRPGSGLDVLVAGHLAA